MLDIPGSGKPRDKAFRARATGLWLVVLMFTNQ